METKTIIQEVQSEILTRSSSAKVYKLHLKQVSSNPDSEFLENIKANADITESVILEKNLESKSELINTVSSVNEYPQFFDIEAELTHSSFIKVLTNSNPDLDLNLSEIEKAETIKEDVVNAITSTNTSDNRSLYLACLHRNPVVSYLPEQVSELPSSIDTRESIIPLPSTIMSDDREISSSAIRQLIEHITPIPPIEDVFAEGNFNTQTRGVRVSIHNDISRMLASVAAQNDPEQTIARFQSLRRSAVGLTGRSDLWYQPGDTLPQTPHSTIFKFILTKLFGIFSKKSLFLFLEFLKDIDISLPDNLLFLNSISTIVFLKLLKPLFLTIMPPSFWHLSFFTIKQNFILVLENLLQIHLDPNRDISQYLRNINLNFDLQGISPIIAARLWVFGRQIHNQLGNKRNIYLNNLLVKLDNKSFIFSNTFFVFVGVTSGIIIIFFFNGSILDILYSFFAPAAQKGVDAVVTGVVNAIDSNSKLDFLKYWKVALTSALGGLTIEKIRAFFDRYRRFR